MPEAAHDTVRSAPDEMLEVSVMNSCGYWGPAVLPISPHIATKRKSV